MYNIQYYICGWLENERETLLFEVFGSPHFGTKYLMRITMRTTYCETKYLQNVEKTLLRQLPRTIIHNMNKVNHSEEVSYHSQLKRYINYDQAFSNLIHSLRAVNILFFNIKGTKDI